MAIRAGLNRSMYPTAAGTPAEPNAAARRRAAAESGARGFSMSVGIPAAASLAPRGSWRLVGQARTA